MQKIRDALKQVGQVLQPGERIVFIDYPVHANVGDLLIQEGTERFFESHGIHPIARYSVHLFFMRKISRLPRDCTIVFHGGGNFGDLHHPYQSLREKIIVAHPDQKIVILPQSIHFSSPIALAKASAILGAHPNLHIFCRDSVSYDLSRQHFSKKSYLSPDMAHFLYPILKTAPSEGKTLLLLRRDNEIGESQSQYNDGRNRTVDWDDIVSLSNYGMIRSFTALHLGAAKVGISPGFYSSWRLVQKKVIADVVREFSKYEYITASRLHAHILATLMDIPNTVIDNSYGKNSRYFSDWTSSLANARLSAQAA
jgi:pyruvyl transferase EpsO